METWFVVTVGDDGELATYNVLPKDLPADSRPANNWDIYQAAKQIVEEFDSQRLAERVAQVVISQLKPVAPPKVSDRISDALKERGINPESITPAE